MYGKLTNLPNNSIIFSVDCKWSSWGRWSSCSKSCGNGFQERKRTVIKYAKNGGKGCVGSNRARQSCNRGKCSTGKWPFYV